MANISNWHHQNVSAYLLLLLVLNFIKEPEGINAHVPLALQHHCLVCRLIIQLYDLCKAPNISCFISLYHNNGLAQKTHCAELCSIANKDNLDGFFRKSLAVLSHSHSINNCCLELDNVIRDNKHAATMMLDTRSTISRGSKAKNFTITSKHLCCLIFCWLNETKKQLSEFQCLVFFGYLVPDVHEGGTQEQERHKNRLDGSLYVIVINITLPKHFVIILLLPCRSITITAK